MKLLNMDTFKQRSQEKLSIKKASLGFKIVNL